jgi:Ca2+-binding EF-hand superfamily protein
MKKCGVTADVCKRMKASEVNVDLSVNAATGAASGAAASGATGVDSIRKQRLQKAKKNGGVTGPSSNGDKLKNAAATGTATGPSANKASSSTGVALSKKQKHDDFMKLLKIFDQNSNKHIGWDEIVAVTGHDDPKMRKEFQAAAGADMQMDYKEFHKFMNKEENAKFFFM